MSIHIALTAFVALALAACAAPEQRAREASGTYVLERVNGQPLPVTTASWGDCSEDVLGASLTLYPDGAYVLTTTTRQSCGGRSAELVGMSERGRYAIAGETIRFQEQTASGSMAAASLPPGWVASAPNRRIDLTDIGGTATLGGGGLAATFDNGQVKAQFRRQADAGGGLAR